jgi:hypothetical protein
MRGIVLLIAVALPLAAQPVITSDSAPAVVLEGSTHRFTARCKGTCNWSLAPGSAGAIDHDGVYHAPAKVTVNSSIDGCQLFPPDHGYNVRIDSLPAHPESAAWDQLLLNGGRPLALGPDFPVNVLDAGAAAYGMTFAYTVPNNSPPKAPYQVPPLPGMRVQTGYYYGDGDHHLIGVRPDTCAVTELYAYKGAPFPYGGSASAGTRYSTLTTALPSYWGGATDAAGTFLLSNILRVSEVLKAIADGSNVVKHPIRITLLNSSQLGSAAPAWPASAVAVNASNVIPYGGRFRLKSSGCIATKLLDANCNYTGKNPATLVILNTLKQYGLIATDGGFSLDASMDTDRAFPALRDALGTELPAMGINLVKNLEAVDESALAPASANAVDGGLIDPAKAAAIPGFVRPQFAGVVVTDSANGRTATMRIALEGAALDVEKAFYAFQAGADAYRIPYHISGVSGTSVTWSMSPALGTLDPASGTYSPPASLATPASTVLTVRSNAVPLLVAQTRVVVMPGGVLGLLTSAPGNYTDSRGQKWWAVSQATDYPVANPGLGISSPYNDGPVNSPDSYIYSYSYHPRDDTWIELRVPNGKYRVTAKLPSASGHSLEHLEAQGQIIYNDLDRYTLAGGVANQPVDLPMPALVTDGVLQVYARRRDQYGGKGGDTITTLPAILIEPDAGAAPHLSIDPAPGSLRPGQTQQFHCVGWYMSGACTWSIASGPGSITSTGLYTVPATGYDSAVPVTVSARSTADRTITASASFNLTFGAISILPADSVVDAGRTVAFHAKFNAAAYPNVTWSLSPQVGQIDASGFYTAPDSLAADTRVTIRASSTGNPSHTASTILMVRKTRPPVRLITSFEQENPFSGGTVVSAHATDGAKALLVGSPYAVMSSPQDWAGYDYLKVDTYVDSGEPMQLVLEIRDAGTTGYWTRVNYETVLPPGPSTLVLPLNQLYVGEKSRPGRALLLGRITRLVFAPVSPAGAQLFIDRLRLERDTTAGQVQFEGLHAFDFGRENSPVMDGFTAVTPSTLYSPARGYGLKDAKVWRALDALQPDPLYQDFICIESGGLAVDVPNGTYRVFVNIDSPGAFWGDYQLYRERSILAQRTTAVSEQQDFKKFLKKYFYFWDTEDLPFENVFDKYGRVHFQEKTFDVNVKNGQLFIEFNGTAWACCVSTVIIFPIEKAAQGERFLEYVREKRRFYFDNSFKRVLHAAAGDPLRPSAEDERRGYVVFQRDLMKDVCYNDTPYGGEEGRPISVEAFAGQETAASFSVLPLKDLDAASVAVSALTGPKTVVPAAAIEAGYVSYRLQRVTASGSVYTIAPRYVIPRNTVAMPRGITRRFWLTVHTPAVIPPGTYTGQVTFTPQQGAAASMPLRLTILKGTLDRVDIPVGPFGGPLGTPWFPQDRDAALLDGDMTEKGLRLLRAHGFTMFTGVPYVAYKGFTHGKPVLDFSFADRQMATARRLGFVAVNSYGAGVAGLDAYQQDTAQMKAAGFADYSAFVKAIYAAVQQHAMQKNWPSIYWNIGDEPSDQDLKKSIDNAAAYRRAFPDGPPFFTAATSLSSHEASDPRFVLAKALGIANLNQHDEASVQSLRKEGGRWAFYNGGNRWTYGVYLYKAAKEFGLEFRLAWHWNAVAGDPYYALDCREDDYSWVNAGPEELVPSVEFFRITAGLDDYRCLLTLARLANSKAGTPAAKVAQELIRSRMASFHLGDRDHDRLFGVNDWTKFRQQVIDAIEALQ